MPPLLLRGSGKPRHHGMKARVVPIHQSLYRSRQLSRWSFTEVQDDRLEEVSSLPRHPRLPQGAAAETLREKDAVQLHQPTQQQDRTSRRGQNLHQDMPGS